MLSRSLTELMALVLLTPGAHAWLRPCAFANARSRIVKLEATSSTADFITTRSDEVSNPKQELMAGLQREYDSFFQPMEDGLYNPDVSFSDPLISLSGVDAYRNNVDMLAGKTLMGRTCFSDCGLIMHKISESADGGLETRWTLQFRFKLLPWQPLCRFTGVSKYTLDSDCRVLRQQDFWDSINLQPGGGYAPASKLAALLDLLGQMAPGGYKAEQSSSRELPYVLLRRAPPRDGLPGYEVRRYPQHVSACTEYWRRLDAFGTLGAYTNGANEAGTALTPYVPSLMSVPYDSRSLEQITGTPCVSVLQRRPRLRTHCSPPCRLLTRVCWAACDLPRQTTPST